MGLLNLRYRERYFLNGIFLSDIQIWSSFEQPIQAPDRHGDSPLDRNSLDQRTGRRTSRSCDL